MKVAIVLALLCAVALAEEPCLCPKIISPVCGQPLGEAVAWYDNACLATCAKAVVVEDSHCGHLEKPGHGIPLF
ncbi:hypothetical protein DPMN_170968 [Dreissena polymorpha]|uniref:Kazal-like domain-containing protein n=1 Tax=Dreissena polymorpha TaxID=45954 RepID=A0A9D4E0D6_DREPO|nr:hypothetical protein DPMN_170942 [Dreissena polymorpha]KAH3769694.1 hypothetical protein DPMN_170968 [Dreissena polymorpha]